DGKGELALDLPPGLFGTVQLVSYRFGREGLPVRKTRVVYVAPADGLKIQATLDKDEYRPRRQATLNVRLIDANGLPHRGALSLAAVDEKVYAVTAQRPGMEQTFHNLEQELLKPVYAIYPWAPGKGASDAQRDQALLAVTATKVGDPHSLTVRTLPQKEQ